ncbi:protein HOMOLOG OF MAMMALIAN LYST-INTERACTING PROTEIN 5 [Corylus avellana]|uniref:protein HOMOLOG OF MAMMALIAN LYST-INTERACTING PROTEIN 5 n=1 Tax=Corylus avellana TaxID=13451 RepID=UPI001E1F655D|nr:protein HOMOLOG OF MAMMALIAN LYST-INTERACTING PROTEIN 5 [Corylus avellana]
MASENEPAKLLLPYLQRADELQKHEPLVAYYCRLYAMERGLRIPQSERTKTTNSLLVSLMNQLEKDKKSLKLGPEDHLHLEGFALNVFGKADKQDRAGRSDLNTAKTFYAASIFFEILNQFGVLPPDLEEKQKYAVWKAADIRKALKEGRKPTPGPPAGDDDLSVPSNSVTGAYELGPSETSVTNPGPESDLSPQFHDKVNNQHSTHMPPSPQVHDKDNQHFSNIPPAGQFHDKDNQHFSNIPPAGQFHDKDNQHFSNIPPAGQFHDKDNQHFSNIPPAGQFHDKDNQHFSNIPPAGQFPDKDDQHSTYVSPSPPSYPNSGYPSHDFHPPPATNRSESPTYSQPYNHQSYPQEPQQPQQHLPSNYSSLETSPSYSYPHFQSYPSFTESSLPAVPSQYPSYYQGSDASYSHQSAPPVTNYSSTAPYRSPSANGSVSEPSPPPAQKFQYDINYLPAPEKIAEAHKAARFAVGALAFDDVTVAVDFLKKSLELLTNPSAGQ